MATIREISASDRSLHGATAEELTRQIAVLPGNEQKRNTLGHF